MKIESVVIEGLPICGEGDCQIPRKDVPYLTPVFQGQGNQRVGWAVLRVTEGAMTADLNLEEGVVCSATPQIASAHLRGQITQRRVAGGSIRVESCHIEGVEI